MNQSAKDALLPAGEMLARVIQWVCALAGGIVLLLIPIIVLLGKNMLPGFGGGISSETVKASPLTVVVIFALLTAILVALFSFFGKLRAIIVSAGSGDPFTPENARRLGAMAWLFLGVKILATLVAGLRLHLASLIDKDAGGSNSLGFSLYDLDAIVIVIVLFILARIFRHGAAMREDLRGTV